MNDEKLLEAIKELELIEEKKLNELYKISQERKTGIEKLLLERDVISKQNMAKVKSYILNLPFFSSEHTSVDREALEVIPEIVAKKQKIVAFGRDEKGLKVAMADPENTEIIEFLKKKTGLEIEIFYTSEDEILDALALYSFDTKEVFDEIISRSAGLSEPPIQELVNKIIDHAYKNRSSDIHIEPLNEKSLVRFRIDGIMHDIIDLPLELHPQIITRIKVMANLQTDEHLTPQDGKITMGTEMENLDLRVSIVPTTEGEKVVMRLLSERSRQFSLQDLGFGQKDFDKVENAYSQPHGMILVTGPTGSGKTTTLYAIIKLLNRREVNITTIEDPVEYSLEGINQIQTNQITGLTFAKGLRSLVRQDPDIILVGEIRDEETASIAINSAMTGHLVLS
ncbi:MAG TPA: type II/IV secretion system protein, partial [candidate division WWE3 bacterium]|nr:type II/IV secretion system protein [candidate division WWE3 bacterium]